VTDSVTDRSDGAGVTTSRVPTLLVAVAIAAAACAHPSPGEPAMTSPTRSTLDLVDGPQGLLHLDDGGAGGTPVLLVHSAAGSTAHWAPQLAHLRRTRRAVALDVRGHGRSAPPRDGSYAVAAMGADVLAAADAAGLRRFVLVGHSQGAAVAIAAAAQAPGRVAGLVLLDPATDGRLLPRAQVEGLVAALRSEAYPQLTEAYWREQLAGARPQVAEVLLADLRATRREAVIGGLEALLAFDPVTPLRSFPFPRLAVITRLNDRPDALHRLVPDLPVERVEGTGHWLQLDAPEAVNAALDRFLAAVP
jgi:pimeloyl-ACP methyl ester carboxylesterase